MAAVYDFNDNEVPGATERDGGVGLGLALVRAIAQRHGGRVACEDRPARILDEGTLNQHQSPVT